MDIICLSAKVVQVVCDFCGGYTDEVEEVINLGLVVARDRSVVV